MDVVGGLVTGLNALLCVVLGVRLLRLGARTGGPERLLGVFFLVGHFGATVFGSIVYMGWADPRLALPDPWLRPLHAAQLATGSLGLGCVYAFTWHTFRPGARWARALVRGAVSALVASFAGFGLTEGFAVRVLNGWIYWLGWLARSGALLWMGFESLRYHALQRRRMRLGLADPLVVNRFLLLGLWAAALFLLGASDPLARVWYWSVTGTATHWLPEAGRPIIVATLALTSALGVVTATTLVLAFFPTRGFRRWVGSRHVVRARA